MTTFEKLTGDFAFVLKKLTSDLETGVFRPRASLATRVITLVVFVMAIQLGILWVLFGLSSQAEGEVAQEAKTRKIVGKTEHIIRLCLSDLPNSLEAYVFATSDTGRTTHQDSYLKARKGIVHDLTWLKRNVNDDQEVRLLEELEHKIGEGFAVTDRIKSMAEAKGTLALHEIEAETKQLDPIIRVLSVKLRELAAAQEKITDDESFRRQVERRDKQRATILLACAFTVLVSIAAIAVFLNTIMRRLNVVVDNTVRLSEKKPLNERLVGFDEIGELDRFFHRMKERLDETQMKERATFEKARDVICTLDHNLCISTINDACQRILDRSGQELVYMPFVDIVHSRDRDNVAATLVSLTKGSEKGDVDFEARILRKDENGFVHMIWSVHWSKADGSLFCVGHDITDRKRIEELTKEKEKFVRQLIEVMPVGLIRADRDGIIEFSNPTIDKMLGYEPGSLVGGKLPQLLEPSGQLNFKAVRSSALKKLVETSAYRKDRTQVPVEFSIETFETESGPRDLAIFFDVTERQEVRKLRNQFVAMITHELRTPLTSIRGYLSLLTMGVFGSIPDEASDAASKAEKNVDRLIHLINDLLDLEKLEAGKMDIDLRNVELASVIERSIDAVSSLAERQEVKMKFEETDVQIIGDEDRLIQVLVNFLSNAVKYSPAGEQVTIAVSTDNGHARISVSDKGQGISSAYIDTIFERFQQARGHKEGTGLGLAISKAIIEGHGGRIGVDSTPGKGSTFWFTVKVG